MTHAQKVKSSKFENINTDNFKSLEHSSAQGVVVASRKERGSIELTSFALIQLIHGGAVIEKASHKLVAKIGIALMNLTSLEIASGVVLDLEREEVVELRNLLEARMLHCEKERDERNTKFNADTYISQKFLLLDIREWLMIEALGEFDIQTPEPVDDVPASMKGTDNDNVYTPFFRGTSGRTQRGAIFNEDTEITQWLSIDHQDLSKRFRRVRQELLDQTYGEQTEASAALTLVEIRKECESRGIDYLKFKEAFGIHQAI